MKELFKGITVNPDNTMTVPIETAEEIVKMIKEKDKQIGHLEEQLIEAKTCFDLLKKEKDMIIEEMARYIEYEPDCNYIYSIYCFGHECNKEHNCKNCIKQYFENKVKE